MKFSDSFYAIGDLQKKRLRILDVFSPRPLTNKSADHL